MIEEICRSCESYSICMNYGGSCRKYKLYRKDFVTDKHNIYLLPTINIVKDDLVYANKNFAIQFHFLIWHGRFLWFRC